MDDDVIHLCQRLMIPGLRGVSQAAQNKLSNRVWTLSESFIKDLGPEATAVKRGLFSFETPTGRGCLMVDKTIQPPVRIITYDKDNISPVYIHDRLTEALAYRNALKKDKLLDTSSTSAYRLVNETGDGFPALTIDVYGTAAQIQMYTPLWQTHLEKISAYLRSELKISSVYLRTRIRDEPFTAILLDGKPLPNDQTTVFESGLKFEVQLKNVNTTGLFLDQKANRRYLSSLYDGVSSKERRTFLNTFSHTASFSVCAAKHNISTTNIEISPVFNEEARKSFRLNNLSLDSHRFLQQDIWSAIKVLRYEEKQFHAVLLDPPSFAETSDSVFTTRAAPYSKMIANLFELVAEDGYLIAFANTKSVTETKWLKLIADGLRSGNRPSHFKTITKLGQDVDFRVADGDRFGHYLKGIVLKKCSKEGEKSELDNILDLPVLTRQAIRREHEKNRERKVV